jgi:hypothetical protein
MTQKAAFTGKLDINGIAIDCAVLEDGTRVLSQRAVTKAIGGKRGGSHWRRKRENPTGANLPVYMSANNLKPFIDADLELALTSLIIYTGARGGVAHGVEASLLPKICNVLLKARDAGALEPQQAHIAAQADILIRGLAEVGIAALVDEATGYQYVRERDDLQQLLSAFISAELMPWTKRFPDEFYRQLFRLRGWQFNPMSAKRPRLIGKLTKNIVYERISRDVLTELETRNPSNSKGTRRHKHHQFLTEDIGHPALDKHISGVIALMRASSTWAQFKRGVQRAYPLPEEQMTLDVDWDEE